MTIIFLNISSKVCSYSQVNIKSNFILKTENVNLIYRVIVIGNFTSTFIIRSCRACPPRSTSISSSLSSLESDPPNSLKSKKYN